MSEPLSKTPVILTMVRFRIAPYDMTAVVTKDAVYEPYPVECVRVGSRRFPWKEVCEYQLATDAAKVARETKKK